MLHVIIAENLHAQEFVENRTMGFEALRKTVANTPQSMSKRSRASPPGI